MRLVQHGFAIYAITLILYAFYPTAVTASTYYIVPTGIDTPPPQGGTSTNPWATFNYAWQYLYPGDTLIIKDGTYTQPISPNVRNGQPDYPITIKAENDGKVILEGNQQRIPVSLGIASNNWSIKDYFIMEGIIAQNSANSVFEIQGNNNIFRRVSGYNANKDSNAHVFSLWGSHNLLEDCVASGTGRKMIVSFSATGNDGDNIIRRCFASWQRWDGANFCPGPWPWGDTLQTYNSSNNILENNIAFGKAPNQGIGIFSQGGALAENNFILGSIAANIGMQWDSSPMDYYGSNYCPSPYNPLCTTCTNWTGEESVRAGFYFGDPEPTQRNNLWQDILAYGNGGLGFAVRRQSNEPNNNRIIRASLANNGIGQPIYWAIQNKSMINDHINKMASITDSYIDGTSYQGIGARLANRYNNGSLTSIPLWPWPMENRIKTEFAQKGYDSNFSVTCRIGTIINDLFSQGKAAEQINPTVVSQACSGTPITPPLSPTPFASPKPTGGGGFTDLDGDNDVDFLDLLVLIINFNSSGPGNFNLTGLVDIFDFNLLLRQL